MSQLEDPTALVSLEAVLSYRRGVPAESSQLDFLLGDWEATTARYRADGSEIASYGGTWSARPLRDGRVILDEFTARLDDGGELSYMATLRTFSPETGRWEMTFLIAHQPQRIRSFSGALEAGEFHATGRGVGLDGRPVSARVRFFEISPVGFRWENRVSLDGGDSWYRDSEIWARRI